MFVWCFVDFLYRGQRYFTYLRQPRINPPQPRSGAVRQVRPRGGNWLIPTGLFGIPQGSQWTQQKGNIGGETNNPLSFLGQKVEGLERTVSHLLQMLKPAYCPPPIPQFQAIR